MTQLSIEDMRKEMKEFEGKFLPAKHWLDEISDGVLYNSWKDVPDNTIREEYCQWKGQY